MHHPNLVQFLGACTRSKPYMLVLEYLPGGRWGCAAQAAADMSVVVHPTCVLRMLIGLINAFMYAVGKSEAAFLLRRSLADLLRTPELHPSLRRAIVMALDAAKAMTYLHGHMCACAHAGCCCPLISADDRGPCTRAAVHNARQWLSLLA
jgi:Protein tyrosine and serine/threonine kinase